MRDSVAAAFNTFTAQFEGYLRFMYLDVKGLVTTGRGNLIDPVGAAMPLPWQHKDGTAATQAEIQAEWARIKALQSIRSHGGWAYSAYATLFLDSVAIDKLCLAKLGQFEGQLRHYFPPYDSWCADAQLGVLSMSWAMGAAFAPGFPHFTVAANAGDWSACAGPDGDANDPAFRGLAWINDTGNPGVRPRNLANKRLFANAAKVGQPSPDPSILYYPGEPS